MNQPDPECYGDQEFEDSLEPRHLIRRTDVVARAGGMMLGAGTSSLRIRQLMRRAATALGLGNIASSITFTSLAMTVE
ncbi:MAG: threonine/serine exporter family protein, partial [Propionibacterium sp.]|nr:threonine/serine exporter family protein [Propionibacterium sp.]